MANFVEEIAPASAPSQQAPVSPDRSGLVAAQGLVQVGQALFANREKELIQQKEAAGNTILAQFQEQQLKIARAVHGGELDSGRGKMLMSANVSKFASSNPSLAADIRKIQKDLVTTTGLAKVVADGTEEEQRFAAAKDAAFKNGWIKPNMSEEQQAEKVNEYLDFQNVLDRTRREQAEITLRSSKVGLVSSERALLEKERQVKAKNSVAEIAEKGYPKFKADIDQVLDRLEQGEIQGHEAVQEINRQFADVQQIMSTAGREAGNEYITNLGKSFEFVKNSAIKVASGELKRDTLNNQIQTTVGFHKVGALKNEEFAKTVAVSDLVRNVPPETVPGITETVQRTFSQFVLGSKPPNLIGEEDKSAVRTTLQIVKGAMAKADTLSPEGKQEVDDILNKTLQGVNIHASPADKVKDYAPVVELLASPEAGKYLSKPQNLQDFLKGNMQEAKSVLQTQYMDKVLPKIQEGYSRALTVVEVQVQPLSKQKGTRPKVTKKEAPALEAIKPVFRGGAVIFEPAEGLSEEARNRAAVEARKLNSNVAPELNKLVKLASHLEGHTDYRKTYQETFNGIFSPAPEREEELTPIQTPAPQENSPQEPTQAAVEVTVDDRVAKAVNELKAKNVSKEDALALYANLPLADNRLKELLTNQIEQAYGG